MAADNDLADAAADAATRAADAATAAQTSYDDLKNSAKTLDEQLKTLAADNYQVIGHSKSGGKFTITKANTGTTTRTCTPTGSGACPSDGKW